MKIKKFQIENKEKNVKIIKKKIKKNLEEDMKKVLTLSVLARMMMTFSVANAKTTTRNRVTKKTVAKKVTPKKAAPKKVVQKTAAKPEKPASSTCGVPAPKAEVKPGICKLPK